MLQPTTSTDDESVGQLGPSREQQVTQEAAALCIPGIPSVLQAASRYESP